ncbi:MAG: glycine--tRNA ligase, partial [Verrucomicrobiia bacterium]
NFIFRSREFEQMEIEYFISPEADWETIHQDWITYCHDWLLSIGLPEEMLGRDVHEKLAHYARACTDITFEFPFGKQELWGIAARSNFDLTQHAEHSGKTMEIFDEATKTKYIPHVIEPSLGVDRLLLALLTAAYTEDEVGGEKRSLMKFHPRIAPYKVAVLPLLKNKPELVERAKGIYEKLQLRYNTFWDASGAIGRRYRRMDEIGTPWCVTIDFDTIEKDGTVTLRDRDTTEQKRVTEEELYALLDASLH